MYPKINEKQFFFLKPQQKILKESVGSQDQIACAIGGLNEIKFEGNVINYKKIEINSLIKRLVSNSTIIFTGYQRKSNIIEMNKITNIKQSSLFVSPKRIPARK